MKIKKIEPLPNIFKFRNKEDFANRLVQEVVSISKKSLEFSPSTKKIAKLKKYEEQLKEKNEKLNKLLEKSKQLTENLKTKIQKLNESNSTFKNKLLQIIENK